MATPTRPLLHHPLTPLVVSIATLLIGIAGFFYLDHSRATEPTAVVFICQGLVILGAFVVIQRLRRVPYGKALHAAGGLAANQTRLMLAVLPVVLAIAICAYTGLASIPDAIGHGSYSSAHWYTDNGHYYVRYDQLPPQEITRQEYEEVGQRMNGLFGRLWVFFGLTLVSASLTAHLWPGRHLLAFSPETSPPEDQVPRRPRLFNPLRIVFRADPVRIPIAGVGSIALERLRHATPRSAWSTLFSANVIGKVSDSGVRLRRYQPFWRNNFAPVLVGQLENGIQGSAIVGVFRMTIFVRMFMCVWFGGVSLIFLTSLWVRLQSPGDPIVLVVSLLMIAGGYGVLLLGQSDWDQDCRVIEDHVRGVVGTVQR